MGIPAVEARQRFTTCAVACPAPTNCSIVPDRSYWISGSYAPPWSEKRTSFLKAIEKERLQGEKGDNNWAGRHRHSHAPGMQQEPPLIVRQVSSHTASSGCSRPASRSPRAPVREGQRQRLPAPTSALSSPTAQRGMVFAPSASRRQRSPGKTPWVAGGAKPRAPSAQRGILMPYPSVTHHQAPQRPTALGGRCGYIATGARGRAGGGAPGVCGPSTLGLWPWGVAGRSACRKRTRMPCMRVMLDPMLREPTGTPSALPRPGTPRGATAH
jgi:hypothetical protein